MVYKTINVLYPVASERNPERCGTTIKPKHSLGENCKVSANKRKASTKPESPRKRLRCASGPAQLAVETVPEKGSKRKASTQIETPSKKQKVGPKYTDSNEPNRATSWKEEDRTEQLTSIRAHFEAEYLEPDMLGEEDFGSVYAGRRKADNLPVAIKHIPKEDVTCRPVVLDWKTCMVPLEALLMTGVGGGPESVGKSAAVSILDWYNLELEVLLVMERPVRCDLLTYMRDNGPLEEDAAKNIMKQLVDAANDVFHRDIKAESLVTETGTNDTHVQVIDFGCCCIVQEEPYSYFSGTEA